MHDRFSIILNIMCGNMGHLHELLDILGIVNNVIMHDINIAIPIRSKMLMVDAKWMQNLMDDFARCITIVFTVHLILGQPNVLFASLLSCDTPTSFSISYFSYLDIIFFCLPWAVKVICFYLLWCSSNSCTVASQICMDISKTVKTTLCSNITIEMSKTMQDVNKIAYFLSLKSSLECKCKLLK